MSEPSLGSSEDFKTLMKHLCMPSVPWALDLLCNLHTPVLRENITQSSDSNSGPRDPEAQAVSSRVIDSLSFQNKDLKDWGTGGY